jgi:hypothetical protein
MSLVNDALKRAKDAQQKAPPSAPAPILPPAAAASAEKRALGMAAPVIIAALAIIGLLFVWKNHHQTAEIPVAAKPASPVSTIAETKPPVQPVAVLTPAPAAPAKPPAPAPAASTPAPPLKLQAIFFAPGRSTAMISGKTVRVGNTFRGYRVAAITEASTTLVSATETNVMTLEQ